MAKIDKLIARLLVKPADFTWDELLKVLNHFGYKEMTTGKTSGSRRKFVDENNFIINIHKPHPGNVVKYYLINQIIQHLKEKMKIKDE
jgi:predicted RNA binding protein YcfA (HicA-like mRNA interferase family)